MRYAAEAFGYHEPELEALRCFVGPPLRGQFMKRYGVDAGTAEQMVDKYRERYSVQGLNECSVYPGVPELVRALRAMGRNVAIATGKPTAFTRSILERAGYGGALRPRAGQRIRRHALAEARGHRRAAGRYGREGAVMIGDRDNDVLGARACSIPCIGVAWGYAEPGELLGAGAISLVETVDELKNLLIG